MTDKQKQIEELMEQIEILKQELKDKESLLNGLLDILSKESEETE